MGQIDASFQKLTTAGRTGWSEVDAVCERHDAYDDAMAESFFASLECERIDRRSWKSKAEAKMAVFAWIEAWYNASADRRRG